MQRWTMDSLGPTSEARRGPNSGAFLEASSGQGPAVSLNFGQADESGAFGKIVVEVG